MCKYCKLKIKANKELPIYEGNFKPTIAIKQDELWVVKRVGSYNYEVCVKIKYCPMCGKKLGAR